MILRALLFLILTTSCINSARAQENIIHNPSFEDYSNCPEYVGQLYLTELWFNPTANSPDYFNACAPIIPEDNSVYIPFNCVGSQLAFDGNAYAGIGLIYNNFNGREYIACHLTKELTTSVKYNITFYISLADSSNAAVGSIGAYFFKDSFYVDDLDVLNVQPQFQHHVDSIVECKNDWTKISGSFTATGGEKFMIIGNFLDDAHTNVDSLPTSHVGYLAYYYIDDVSLYEIPEDTTPTHPTLQNAIAVINLKPPTEPLIIPTLISGKDLYWQFIHLQPNTSVKLYNALGQLVFSSFNYQNNLSVNFLAAGVYFYEVAEENGERENGKVIVIR